MKKWILWAVALAVTCLLIAPSVYSAQEPKETKSATLIRGLDGGTYESYLPAIIEKVQTALKEKGLYQGEVDGQLDEETMKAIGEFQKTNGLTVSGVPSPSTRKLLLGD